MVYGSTLKQMTPDELESYLCDISEYVGALEELDRTNEEYIKCLNATVRALTRKSEAKFDSLDKYGAMEESENWLDEKYVRLSLEVSETCPEFAKDVLEGENTDGKNT